MARPDLGTARRKVRRAGRAGTIALAIAAFISSGCEPRVPEPVELRVSAIPDQTWAQVLRQHEALVELVCAGAKIRCRWVEVPTYEALVEKLGRGEIDLAFLGGVTFVQASHRYGVVPLAVRDIDFRFTSSVVVRADAPERGLEELRGKTFAFGAPSSTSGHFMVRYFLQRRGIEPERDFARVVFSGSHDRTLRMVESGEVYAGAVNSSIAYASIGSGGDLQGKLRIIWQTPPFTDYVWAAGPQLPEPVRRRLIDSFLDLDGSTAERRVALAREQARGFLPCYDEDFSVVREVVRDRGAL